MSQSAKEILQAAEAVLSGHFVYTSGKHGPDYIQKDKVYTRPRHLDALCVMMAEWVYDNGMLADVVAAPAVGGINLATGVARELNRLTGRDILAVYAEPADDVVYESKGECLATLQLNSLLTKDPSPTIAMFNGDKVIVRKKRMEFRRGYHELIRGRHVLAVEDVINTGGSLTKFR
jgi:orotate phosphoribosyltransferase